jgi:pyruvate/2-oxoacid:ferredoxin oxidoreductase alpha subunit
MVTQDGFLLSHTSMVVDLPPQDLVDAYLPPLDLALRARTDRPRTYGQMMGPRETQRHREEIQAAMARVPEVLDEAGAEFARVFGRRPRGAFEAEHTADADTVLIAAGTTVSTLRRVVEARRSAGEKIGLVQLKLFRPFLRDELARAIGAARRVAVLDRDYSPGSGGIMWTEIATSLRERPDVLLQGYIVGLGGGEVDPPLIELVLDDLAGRERSQAPIFFPRLVG